MKKIFLILCLPGFFIPAFSQAVRHDSLKIYSTAIKINLSGARIGIEKKLFNRTTLQIEGLYLGSTLVKVNPQIRYYPKFFKRNLSYFGIGYYYKHKENNYSDSVRITGTDPYYVKHFSISRYIHALTLNYGVLFDEKVLKKTVHLELNAGVGIRYKKSERYGILPNEEIDLREAYIMRPQAYQDTQGRFVTYLELNLMFTVVLPIIK